nr:DAP3-binding cell death enhancer 1-like [Lytechinus pictus]
MAGLVAGSGGLAPSFFWPSAWPPSLQDHLPSDVQPGGLQKTSNEKPSPPLSVSPTTQVPSFNQSSDSSFLSSSSIPTGIPPPSAGESKVPFDQVTRQCWGRVNNIIGGHLMSEGDEEKAVHHFKIASQSGYSKGQYNLGMCYELGKGVLQDDMYEAAVFFGLAAEQGHSHAQYKLGTYHLDGRGNVKQCEQTALTLIAQAAEGGVVQAQSYLGMYYMTSEEPDPQRAVAYLQEAAQKKDAEAQYHLGLCYEYGWGVETNEARASSLYHSAASKDHAPSLYSLALLHEQGLGGKNHNPHAKELFIRSSSLGYERLQKLLEMDAEKQDSIDSDSIQTSTLSSDSWSTSSESGSGLQEKWISFQSILKQQHELGYINMFLITGAPMCFRLENSTSSRQWEYTCIIKRTLNSNDMGVYQTWEGGGGSL